VRTSVTRSKGCGLILALGAALALPAGSMGRETTTVPSKKVTILVLIDDRGMTVTKFQAMSDSSNPELLVLRGPVPRGDYVAINVINRGKKAHDFVFLGKKTKRIEPGRTAHLFLTAVTRGSFPYRSTLDKGPRFRGHLTVF
jgi:hypothetical protein